MAWKAAPSFSRSRLACQCPVIQVCVNDTDICDTDIRDSDICDSDICDSDMHDSDMHDSNVRDSDIRDSDIRDSGSPEGPASGPGPGQHLYSGPRVPAGFGSEPAPGGGRRTNRSVRIPGNLGPDPAAIRHGVGTSAGPAAQRTWRRSQAATAEALRRSALATATGRHGGGLAQASRTSTVICRAKVAAERRRCRRNEARETQAPAHAGTRIPPTA